MSRVMIVDDEPAILRLLCAVLGREGHTIVQARTAREGLAALEQGVDAMILDLGLPDRDGLELIAPARAMGIPVIVLSARSDVSEKVAALDLGASDYVTKPFDGDELLARLRVVLRAGGSGDSTLEHGPIRIDLARHEVRLHGQAIAVPPKEFAVLQALLEAGGRVLTHRALLEKVWGKAHTGDVEYLRVAIRSLRRKIEVDPAAPRLIRNEPSIGYRMGDL